MTPRKSNGSNSSSEPTLAKNAAEWVAQRIASLRARRSVHAVKMPRRKKLHAVQPTWWSAFCTARLAVRSGIPLEPFLQHRMSQHLARLPVQPSRLPVTFGIADAGAIVETPNAASAQRPPWLDSFLRAEGPAAVNPEIMLGQADAARLAARIDVQRKRVDELTRDVEDATRGVSIADPGDEAQAQQMGRPSVPPPIGVGLQIFAVALLLAESWPLAVPCLEAGGIQTAHLVTELQRDPVAMVLGSLFALGASATLFLFAHLALRRILDSVAALEAKRHRAWTTVAAVSAALLMVGMAWSIAGAHPGAGLAFHGFYTRITVFLAVLAIPFTSAWLLALARRMEESRAAARALARTWDMEHYRILADVSRRAGALMDEERRLSRLEAERSGVIRRLRGLQQRCATAERLAADAAAQEEEELSKLSQAIAAALELDRYEYLRQACARGVQVTRGDVPPPKPSNAPARPGREVPDHNLGLAG